MQMPRPSAVMILTHLPLDKMAGMLAEDNFKCIFLNENDRMPIWISLKFIPRSPIDNKPALVQVMAWRRTGDKPLPELMLTQFTDADELSYYSQNIPRSRLEGFWYNEASTNWLNWPNSQIPECTCSISHNDPFKTEMCTFLFWMDHCGIWNSCILGFMKLAQFDNKYVTIVTSLARSHYLNQWWHRQLCFSM